MIKLVCVIQYSNVNLQAEVIPLLYISILQHSNPKSEPAHAENAHTNIPDAKTSVQFDHFAVVDISTVWREDICASECTTKGRKDLASRNFNVAGCGQASQLWQVFKAELQACLRMG
jgi:hypothetical protein